jgi:hypothetical protein
MHKNIRFRPERNRILWYLTYVVRTIYSNHIVSCCELYSDCEYLVCDAKGPDDSGK